MTIAAFVTPLASRGLLNTKLPDSVRESVFCTKLFPLKPTKNRALLTDCVEIAELMNCVVTEVRRPLASTVMIGKEAVSPYVAAPTPVVANTAVREL